MISFQRATLQRSNWKIPIVSAVKRSARPAWRISANRETSKVHSGAYVVTRRQDHPGTNDRREYDRWTFRYAWAGHTNSLSGRLGRNDRHNGKPPNGFVGRGKEGGKRESQQSAKAEKKALVLASSSASSTFSFFSASFSSPP
eukprot:GHVT01028079.1.p2 GENE.GHVT01028079.1~~GHVT01028079.1.p2  ORF type:complete len:143 (-),score=27.53 GHVT01028079.1:444-872(-)